MNCLAGEKSPYLLQHAGNPVHWQPWGEAAFERARAEDKPIFLSIGYSTCHWCHVMAHESFEDPEIAALMNTHFVNVKVDREERPDVDRIYMAFVQATTGSGGWPMSVWLTPGLEPFAGGTYFPPRSTGGRPGFPQVLEQIAKLWREERETIQSQAGRVLQALREQASAEPGNEPHAGAAEAAVRQFARAFDPEEGGFGGAPKFPRPSSLLFLFRQDGSAREMALHTLRKMCAGGIRDFLGGGFHRYSVDRFWHVPHFEKMLYDQAQITVACVEAFQITGEAVFAGAARDTVAYVLRDLAHPGGGLYSAEDADSLLAEGRPEHAEGAFYVWDENEIVSVLGAEAALFAAAYGVESGGNAPDGADPHGEFVGKNILIRREKDAALAIRFGGREEEIARRLAEARATLFAVRERRPRSHRDEKILTAWNGLMISALARAGSVLGEPRWIAAAAATADFLRRELASEGGRVLLRSWKDGPSNIPAFAEDYAFLIQGLLDLFEADFDAAWLRWAMALQETLDARFADPRGGYFSTAAGDPGIVVRMKEDHDGAEPSATSVAALNLARLARMTGREKLAERARAAVDGFSALLDRMPMALPQMLVAQDFLSRHGPQMVLAAAPGDPGAEPFFREIHRHFLPGRTLLLADGGELCAGLAADLPQLRKIRVIPGAPKVFLCAGVTCLPPISDLESLCAALGSSSG